MKIFLLKTVVLFLCFNNYCSVHSQVLYKGTIGSNHIEMMLRISADNEVTGAYTYVSHGTPFKVKGKLPGGSLKGLKILFELDENGNVLSTFEISKHQDDDSFSGSWTSLSSHKEMNFTLTKDMVVSAEGNFGGIELFQSESLPDKYFKLVLRTDTSSFTTFVEKVRVFDKKNDMLVQEISGLNCDLMYFDNVSVFDYNFDGNPDFSVFASYKGSLKTQRIYFLFNSKTKIYDQCNILEKKSTPQYGARQNPN